MPTSVHASGLKECFEKNASNQSHWVLGAKIAVTNSIVAEYHAELGGFDVFRTWMQNAIVTNRIRMAPEVAVTATRLSAILPEYLTSAYFGGMRLIVDSLGRVGAVDQHSLLGAGIELIEVCALVTQIPDNPIDVLSFKSCGSVDIETMARYFRGEKRICFYDRYLNERALKTICRLLRDAASDASVTVFRGFRDSDNLDVTEIKRAIDSIPTVSASKVKVVSRESNDEHHDRYAFIGDRLFIRGTAGFDSFESTAGGWKARSCMFTVFDVFDGYENFTFNFKDRGRSVTLRGK